MPTVYFTLNEATEAIKVLNTEVLRALQIGDRAQYLRAREARHVAENDFEDIVAALQREQEEQGAIERTESLKKALYEAAKKSPFPTAKEAASSILASLSPSREKMCPRCQGRKKIVDRADAENSFAGSILAPCPECNGTGRVS